MTFRPLPIMTLCVIVSLGILVMLGHWQWERFSSKESALAATPEWTVLNVGELVDNGVFYMSTIFGGRAAWREILAIDIDGEITLVTNGVVFSVDPPERPLYDIEDIEPEFGEGLFRVPPKPGAFTPPSDMASRLIFGFDFEELEAVLGRPVNRAIFEPRRLMARDQTGDAMIDNPQADPALADPLPPARHLGYALTWWGMALGLLIMYIFYHKSVGRLTFGTSQLD